MSVISNRDFAINVLRVWWNATPMAQLGFTSYSDAISHYDTVEPGFLETFGSAVRSQDMIKLQDAMKALAAKYGTAYPKWDEFFNFAAQYVGQLSMGDLKDAAAESVTDLKNIALTGVALYAVVGAVLLFIFVKGKMKK